MFTSQNPDPNARRTFILFRPFVAMWHWLFPPTVAHRDRQSSASRFIAAGALVVFFVGIAVAAVVFARPLYNYYQTWQSNRKIERAAELEKQDRMLEAWITANEAYQLDPENPTVIRTLARYYTARGQVQAFYLLDKLKKLGVPETDDDRLLRIQALANSNEIKDAQVQIEELLKASPPSARMVEIADNVLRRQGRTRQLLDILRTYVGTKPDDLDIRLMFATRSVQLGTADEVSEGMQMLWELAETPSQAGLGALKFLDQQKLEDAAAQRKLVDLLQKHPLSGEEERIAALRLLVKLEPARRAEIIEKAMEERRNASREDLVPLARWLALDGEHERLLGYLKKELVQDHAPLLSEYLNALTAANRFGEMEALVRDPRTRLSVADRAFRQAHLAYATKKNWNEVNSLLLEALVAAQADMRPQYFIKIAEWAEKRGHPLVAEQAYQAASVNPVSDLIQHVGFEGLLRLTYRNGNSEEFLETAQKTARRWPENQYFLERSLYASLLFGVGIEMAVPQAEKLLQAKPDDAQRKLIMALALYRMMDPKAALRYVNHMNLSELLPGQGAVLCGILYHAGDKTAANARQIAQQIPQDAPMLPEERKFLQQVRPDVAAASGAGQPGQP